MLTSCKPDNNNVEMILIRTKQYESNCLLSYLSPQLLPHRKPR